MQRAACRQGCWLCSPAAQAAEQHRQVEAALSPSLHQVHLHNKFLGLIPNRSAMTKPFFCSPGWSSSPSPACRTHLLWDDETSPSGHPEQQLQLQQSKSTKHGPLRGHPPVLEQVASLGRTFLLPRTLEQRATTANMDPVLQRRTW